MAGIDDDLINTGISPVSQDDSTATQQKTVQVKVIRHSNNKKSVELAFRLIHYFIDASMLCLSFYMFKKMESVHILVFCVGLVIWMAYRVLCFKRNKTIDTIIGFFLFAAMAFFYIYALVMYIHPKYNFGYGYDTRWMGTELLVPTVYLGFFCVWGAMRRRHLTSKNKQIVFSVSALIMLAVSVVGVHEYVNDRRECDDGYNAGYVEGNDIGKRIQQPKQDVDQSSHITAIGNNRPKYIVPPGRQRKNTTKIKNAEERAKWWEEYGKAKYGEEFDGPHTRHGEFINRRLERYYRNYLFRTEFSSLPEYETLKKLSPNERDSFYTYWSGRVGVDRFVKDHKYMGHDKDGKSKEIKVPGSMFNIYNPKYFDSFEVSPNGRQAGRILADLNHYFGEYFNDWKIEQRAKFYREWDVAQNGAANFIQAEREDPELVEKAKSIKTYDEFASFLQSSFELYSAHKCKGEGVECYDCTIS